MNKTLCQSLLVVLLLASTTFPVHAWDSFSHMTVAYLAYQKLTPQTRDRVKTLLKKNPYYRTKWSSMVPPGTSGASKDMMILMIAATWADEIKGDRTYKDDGSHNGDRPDGATSSQNIGYTDHLRHKYWHFVDTPFTQDGTALPAVPEPNAQTQIGVFRGVLASSSPDALKSYDLTWLLHLVGDVHQPLHCATRVSSAEPDGDSGGNAVKLHCTGCPRELHAFWDDVLGTSNSAKSAITFAKTLAAPDATLAANADVKDWVAESTQAAEQQVYVAPIAAGDGPFSLSSTYKTAAKAVAKERVALAGVRLANLLNNELK
jgi:hypothetical protein